jgi:hypothetical protein
MGKAITEDQKAQILSMRGRRSHQEIGRIVGVSHATVGNVLRGHRSGEPPERDAGLPARPRPVPPVAAIVASLPDVVPEGTGLERARDWMRQIDDAADMARAEGNLTALASLAAKMTALLEYERKATPIPPADPNDNPDMIEMGERVWEAMKKAFKQ